MQQELFQSSVLDLSSKRVLLPLSGGINSAAVLCYLASEYPTEAKPGNLWIYAIQLKEHSPDTFKFMKDCIRYAARHFKIRWSIRWGSVIKFFEEQNMIPHPILSPCSEELKMKHLDRYFVEHNLDIDLIGFVRSEHRRIERQKEFNGNGKYVYPIAHISNEDCLSLVKREIGWYPAIYDIKDHLGRRVFHHNNCLPCKNMEGTLLPHQPPTKDYANVQLYYPEYFYEAHELADKINNYWGRLKRQKANSGQTSFTEDLESFDGYCHFCELD